MSHVKIQTAGGARKSVRSYWSNGVLAVTMDHGHTYPNGIGNTVRGPGLRWTLTHVRTGLALSALHLPQDNGRNPERLRKLAEMLTPGLPWRTTTRHGLVPGSRAWVEVVRRARAFWGLTPWACTA